MQKYLFKNIHIVNEGKIICTDLLSNERILKIDKHIDVKGKVEEINGEGLYLLPGIIDDQVHFREPGLTAKATIRTESMAAVAGGVTSFMEMPNTIPNALTTSLLEEKYQIAAEKSLANYSFYMGVSNDNAVEVLKVNKNKSNICGVKIFMGSSTGNMLVDNYQTLNQIFSGSELLIACHCEDETIIKENYRNLKETKKDLEPKDHPVIRNAAACFASSSSAIELATKYNSRLHVLHISTEKEIQLFNNLLPVSEKKITSEVCIHHLHFTNEDYDKSGYLIKCNPAIKYKSDKEALWIAMLNNTLDVIATDHAPHLLSEKSPPYENAHSGLPLVQHSLLLMLQYYKEGMISLEKITEKMCHAVADCFQIKDRGYIREGYFADLALINTNKPCTVSGSNIYYKCGWSPFMDQTFPCSIEQTFVNGNKIYDNGLFNLQEHGMRLVFNRN